MKFKNKASGYKKAYRHRFTLLLLSVLISVVGTQMTDFALGVWLYESTKSAMLFSLLSFATIAPMTFCSPLIGILVDRFNHRHLMIAGHLGAGIGSLLMAGLYYYGLLQPWCLILLSAISSCFLGVLFPSFTASLIHLVPQEQLTRPQGLLNAAKECFNWKDFSQINLTICNLVLIDIKSNICTKKTNYSIDN